MPLRRCEFSRMAETREHSDDQARGILSELLGYVLSQQQFAEAKNGALLGLNVAVIMGLGAILGAVNDAPWWLSTYTIWISIGLGAAVALSLFSFLPRLTKSARQEATKDGPIGNPYFFMDIAEMGEARLVSEIYRKLKNENEPGELIHDMANQIATNAIIARRKHRVFRWSAQITLLSLALPTVWLAVTTLIFRS